MRKVLTILILLISSLVQAQTIEKNFFDKNYIEVTGTAEMEITPDQIYLRIIINEKEIKGNNTLDGLEKLMIERLAGLGIDVINNLAIIDLSSNFKYYFIKEKKIHTSKVYELLVSSANTAGKVIQELGKLNISNIAISKVDHSEITDFKMKVKTNAIRAAKEKAEALVNEIDQQLGKALYIKEINNVSHTYSNPMQLSEVMIVNYMIPTESSPHGGSVLPEIEFEKINLRYSILVRFELQ